MLVQPDGKLDIAVTNLQYEGVKSFGTSSLCSRLDCACRTNQKSCSLQVWLPGLRTVESPHTVKTVTMSCFSCGSKSVAERDAIDDLKDQLQLIQGIFPDVAYPSIVNKDGILIATLLNEERLGIDLTATISAIQSAAKHFSSIMGLTGCPHLQISGDTQIFSLYSLHAESTLVFFNNKQNLTDTFELGDALSKVEIQAILREINKVLSSELDSG